MDFIAVTGVNYFLKRRKKYARLFLASLFSSAAGLLLLLGVRNYLLYTLLSHFLLNTLMVFFSFGRCGWREFLENWAVTYLSVILSGGILQWLQESGIWPKNFLFGSMAVIVIGYGILLYLMQRRGFGNHIFLVKMKKDNRSMELRAYWDSGNQLRDPYTGQAVSIISHTKAAAFLDAEKDRIRYVPYRSLGEEEGLLEVTNVDELLLQNGNKTVCMQQMAIGIAGEGLFEGREYDMILHESLL